MDIKRIHHVAYRCRDAKETVEFYQRVLNMDFTVAFAEDQVPSTKEPDPYMHVFLDAGMGNVLAFFELPTQPDMDRDRNTPEWVQHIAFEVEDYDALLAAKSQIEAAGIDVIGPTNHGIFQSIYFFDPNGHRLELVATDQVEKRTYFRAFRIPRWQQGRFRIGFFKVLEYRQGLTDCHFPIVQERYQSLRIPCAIGTFLLFALNQVDRNQLVLELFQIECNPHPVSGR